MNWKKAAWALFAIAVLGAICVVWTTVGDHPRKEITILGEDSSNLQAYSSLAADFQARYGVPVRFQGETFEQSILKATSDFESGRGAFDIVLQYNFSLAPYVRNNWVASVSDVYSPSVLKNAGVVDDVFPAVLKETCFYYSNPQDPTSPPRQFGFPFAANTMLLVYNQQLFSAPKQRDAYRALHGRELEVPTTWDDYLRVARFFSAREGGPKGVVIQGADAGWLYYELANYLFSMGTGTSKKQRGWEEKAPLTIDTPQNVWALEYYRELRNLSAGDYFTVDAVKQREIMAADGAAMAIMWSDYVQPLAAPPGGQAGRFGFAPIPGNVSGIAGGAFYLNRKTKQMQAASDFILLALKRENQERLLEQGLCSPRRSAYTSAALQKVAYAKALRDSLERGVFMFEAGTDAEIISDVITTNVQRFVRDNSSAAETLAAIQREVERKRLGGR